VPGVSGNPGGRPSRDAVVRRLASRRGTSAAALLVELLGGDSGVVVIDGRGVVADELAALRERYRERWGEDEPAGADPFRAALWALSAETSAAAEAFAAEWEHQRGERRSVMGPEGKPTPSWEEGPASWVHRATGERLGPWEWYGRADAAAVAAWEAAVPRLEEAHGLGPGALPVPCTMTKPDPWPGDPPPLEGG
jgi:hypothetical protein